MSESNGDGKGFDLERCKERDGGWCETVGAGGKKVQAKIIAGPGANAQCAVRDVHGNVWARLPGGLSNLPSPPSEVRRADTVEIRITETRRACLENGEQTLVLAVPEGHENFGGTQHASTIRRHVRLTPDGEGDDVEGLSRPELVARFNALADNAVKAKRTLGAEDGETLVDAAHRVAEEQRKATRMLFAAQKKIQRTRTALGCSAEDDVVGEVERVIEDRNAKAKLAQDRLHQINDLRRTRHHPEPLRVREAFKRGVEVMRREARGRFTSSDLQRRIDEINIDPSDHLIPADAAGGGQESHWQRKHCRGCGEPLELTQSQMPGPDGSPYHKQCAMRADAAGGGEPDHVPDAGKKGEGGAEEYVRDFRRNFDKRTIEVMADAEQGGDRHGEDECDGCKTLREMNISQREYIGEIDKAIGLDPSEDTREGARALRADRDRLAEQVERLRCDLRSSETLRLNTNHEYQHQWERAEQAEAEAERLREQRDRLHGSMKLAMNYINKETTAAGILRDELARAKRYNTTPTPGPSEEDLFRRFRLYVNPDGIDSTWMVCRKGKGRAGFVVSADHPTHDEALAAAREQVQKGGE